MERLLPIIVRAELGSHIALIFEFLPQATQFEKFILGGVEG